MKKIGDKKIDSGVFIILIGLVVFSTAIIGNILGDQLTGNTHIFRSRTLGHSSTGSLSTGSSCTQNSQCASGYCYQRLLQPSGTCQPVNLPNGDFCYTNRQCISNICSNNLCSAPYVYDPCLLNQEDYSTYTLQPVVKDLYFTQVDADQNHINRTSARVIEFKAQNYTAKGFLTGYATNNTNTSTDTFWIATSASGVALEFYKRDSSTNRAVRFFNNSINLERISQIDHRSRYISLSVKNDTPLSQSGINRNFYPRNISYPLISFNLILSDGPNLNLSLYLQESSVGHLTYIGHSISDTNQTNDIRYNTIDLSTNTRDMLLPTNIIIYNPDWNAISDRIIIGIPPEPFAPRPL